MGVHGLWDLLASVGRRVSVETLSGKRLAIDASIWLVQFMKAMRDENGDMVRNAHLLGFFRRICKLLYLRTKPVFVFDGGTPALKRRTVIARRRQRENAQAKIRKTAEKLLLNQLKSARLKELAKDLENQITNQKNYSKGKKVTSEQAAKDPSSVETEDATFDCSNQEKLDEMLVASIAAEKDGGIKNASTSAGLFGEDDEYEDLILPDIDGELDPNVLAALPPSIRLQIMMKKRSTMEDRKSHDPEKIEINKKNEKGKEILSPTELEDNTSEGLDEAMESFNQEKLDEMLAASLLAEDNESNKYAETSTASVPFEGGGEDDDDEQMILPEVPGKFDPAVLAALPPSMQLDLLVQMRERLMAENRQRYQKVKKAPEKFSELQIQAYLKTVAFRREIDQVQKAAAGRGVGGVQTSRIASEANREFIFSSSFAGDKQLFTSGGALGTVDQQQTLSGLQSDSIGGNTMAGLVEDKSGSVFDDDDVETYTDERGRIRVSRVRAMGMRMTRDLQRNLDLMKEIEPDTVGTAITQSKTKEKGTSSREFIPSKRQEVRCLDDSSIGSTLLNDRNGPPVANNDSGLQISFEIGDKSFESDDDMFSHLVAGQSADLSFVDNDTAQGQGPDSASDSDWEEGSITTKFDGSSTAQELVYKSSLKVSSVNDDSEVEWEEGPSDINDSLFCQVASGKPISRGQFEEDHDFQEAIRRSLRDLGSDKGFAENEELEAIDPHENRKKLDMVRKDIQERKMNSGPLDVNKLNGESQTNEANEFLPSSKSGMHKLDGFCKSVLEYPGSGFEEHPQDTNKEHVVNVEVPCTHAEQHADAVTEADGLSTPISLCPTDESGISKPDTINSIPSAGADIVENAASILVREGKFFPETGSSLHAVEETIKNSSGAFVQSSESDSRVPADVEEQIGATKIPDAQSAFRDTSNYGSAVANNDNTCAQASLDKEIHILGQEFLNLEDEQRKHERNAESVTSEMFAECQELLQMFGIPYIIAPMEAEAQCAYMELVGTVDGVVTDDSDVLLFGACSVYKNIFDDRKYVETYFMKDIEKELGLTREKLIRMALLLGSDYTEGISGIGIVNAIEVVNAFPEENGLQKFRDWIESPDPTILGNLNGKPSSVMRKQRSKVGKSNLDPSDKNASPMDEKKKCADETQEIKQIFMDKHRNVSKNWYIPSSFPSETVISAYWSPQVDKSAEPFIWGKPDHHLLQRLCWERFGWNIKKSDDLLLPVLKEYNKRETQLRLEAFYTFNERFAKIRSKRIKKAVKGIAGKQSSTMLEDVPVKVPEGTKKKRKRLAESELGKFSNVTETPDISSEHNLSGKLTTEGSDKGRTTGKDISSETGISRQELLSDDRQQTVDGSNEGRRGRANGGRKANGRGRGRGRGKVRQTRGLGQSDHSSSNDEHADQCQKSEILKDVRRSNRLRQQVSYTTDMEMDDVMESVDLDDERKAGENPQNGNSRSASREDENAEHNLVQDDLPKVHLETGGGFCIDESEAGHLDYLESGGGFCVDESERHDDQGENIELATALAGEATEEGCCRGGLMNNVHFGALNESLVDAVNTGSVVKDPNSEAVRSRQSENDLMSSGEPFSESNVKDSAGAEVGGLSAMPFLRRKRKKG
ncbi:DNA repair protein UVH3 [Linum perenne]